MRKVLNFENVTRVFLGSLLTVNIVGLGYGLFAGIYFAILG